MVYARPIILGTTPAHHGQRLAPAITWKASKQAYWTANLFTDRDRTADACRAYAYFRWVDDQIDEGGMNTAERRAFVEQQSEFVQRLYRGEEVPHLRPEERLLADLIRGDRQPDSGLRSYIYHMMAVMVFDAERRGRLISGIELDNYTRWLAVAVTEALHYFIGHRCGLPQNRMRYLAATGAHITHMLRDTISDLESGYFNIPKEVVAAGSIDPHDVQSPTYRCWTLLRVSQARDCFRSGRAYLSQVKNVRCRLAGYAYIARFESVLDAIERADFQLREAYPECKTLATGIRSGLSVLPAVISPPMLTTPPRQFSVAKG